MADAKKSTKMKKKNEDGDDDDNPLNRDGEGGENASGHASVGERVDDVGEQNCEDVAVRLR